MFNKMQEAILAGGQKAADPVHKELMKYVLDQAWAIPTPHSPMYYTWWPWLKNYNGEQSVGYASHYNWTKYVWIDLGLKKSMGY
jgi:peptide/nickel transport system substrate-binding protein